MSETQVMTLILEGINELRAEVACLPEIKAQVACIPEIKAQMSGLQLEVSEIKTQVSGLQTQVSGLQTQVSGLQTQVNGLQRQVNGLEQNLTDFRGEVNARFDRVETELAFHHAKWLEHDRAIWELKQKRV